MHNKKVQEFLAWTKFTYSPDEIFWATVNRFYPDIPGSSPPHVEHDVAEHKVRVRLIKWEGVAKTYAERAEDKMHWFYAWNPFYKFVLPLLFSQRMVELFRNRGFWQTIFQFDNNYNPLLIDRPNTRPYSPCRGQYRRKACVYGAHDLPDIVNSHFWFANKFERAFDSVPLDCLDYRLRHKVVHQNSVQ